MILLCVTDSCFETVNSLDGVGSLLKAMETHTKNAKVVKNVCMVLTTLVEPNGRLCPQRGGVSYRSFSLCMFPLMGKHLTVVCCCCFFFWGWGEVSLHAVLALKCLPQHFFPKLHSFPLEVHLFSAFFFLHTFNVNAGSLFGTHNHCHMDLFVHHHSCVYFTEGQARGYGTSVLLL